MKSAFFIQIITRCNALCPVGAIRIDENGKRTVACGPQNGGGTPANDDAVTLFCKLQNRAALGFKDPRFFRVKRLAQRGGVRKGIARDGNAKILALFVVFRDGGFGKPRFLRGFLNEAFIVAGNPQLFCDCFANFPAAAAILAADADDRPFHLFLLLSYIFSLDRPYRSRKMKYVKSIFDISDISK